ncbi:MAG: diguanylate cyclase [Cycloclasticus sp.]|nr:diguanylate cyclase [Cycloclasticus sp.]
MTKINESVRFKSKLKLTFADQATEKNFQAKQMNLNTRLVRLTMFVAIVLYSVYYFALLPLQVVNYQDPYRLAYAIIILHCLLFYTFTYHRRYALHSLDYNTLSTIAISAGILVAVVSMPTIAPMIVNSAALPLAAFFILFGISLAHALLLSLLYFCALMYTITLSLHSLLDLSLAIFNFFGFFVIASIAGYMLERQKRQVFLAELSTNQLINSLEASKKQLFALSIKDGLTQLFNRRHFDEVGLLKTNEAKRLKSTMHLLMIDVDFFKPYNDHYGHPAGDEALISIASTLLKTLRRSTDLIFRVGGEELAVILLGDDTENLNKISQSVHDAINALAIEHAKSPIKKQLTVSIGIASLKPLSNETFDDLYNKSDKALYLAKQSGRNKTAIY